MFRPDLATHAPRDRSITLLSTQLQYHSSAFSSQDTDPTFPCKHKASSQCSVNDIFLQISKQKSANYCWPIILWRLSFTHAGKE